jgi:tRNA pseudouridine55 synthase
MMIQSAVPHGILLLDKDAGMTSHTVVDRVRRLLKFKEIGHAGTLDPMATGLLVLLLGEATKLSDYILNGDKAYEAQIELGTVTDTLDITGTVLEKNVVDRDESEILSVVQSLSGELNLDIPIYSAKKVNGEKLYEKAFRGETMVKLPQKLMNFYDLTNIVVSGNSVSLSVACGKGSFIRSFAHEIGKRLKVGACLSGLRRVTAQPYTLASGSTSLAELQTLLAATEAPESLAQVFGELTANGAFIPIAEALIHWPTLYVEGHDEKLVSNGQIPYRIDSLLHGHYKRYCEGSGVRALSKRTGQLLALIAMNRSSQFRVQRVFNTN